jgi:hypothetical protein
MNGMSFNQESFILYIILLALFISLTVQPRVENECLTVHPLSINSESTSAKQPTSIVKGYEEQTTSIVDYTPKGK